MHRLKRKSSMAHNRMLYASSEGVWHERDSQFQNAKFKLILQKHVACCMLNQTYAQHIHEPYVDIQNDDKNYIQSAL